MRALLTALAAMLLLGGSTLKAEDLSRQEALAQLRHADAATRRAAIARLADAGTMDDVTPLVRALRDPDEDARAGAEQALWRIWSRSGDPAVDALFQTGLRQMEGGEVAEAIDTFSRIIAMKPDFAEGWNKRATLYFLAGDLRKSIADCDEVLKRNPQHFGALAGYAQIYARLEYYERALDYSRRALAINPNLEGVRRNIVVLEHLVEQRRKQAI